MKKFFRTIRDIFTIKPLFRRLVYTFFFALIYRLGTFVFLPWINPGPILAHLKNTQKLNFWDRLIGTSLDSHSIFSLGISPYISASILIQLATFAIPYFQRIQQEGKAGRSKLNRITRQLAVLMAIAQGLPQVFNTRTELIFGGNRNLYWFYASSVLLMTAGTMFSVWLADRITEKGLGNGASVLIMVNIVAKFPSALIVEVKKQTMFFLFIEFIALFILIVIITIFMQGVRRINLQYARQMLALRTYGGARQYLPIKMNASGVMPIIFANVFIGVVAFVAGLISDKLGIKSAKTVQTVLQDPHSWQCNLAQAALIFAGTFLYTAAFISPLKISNELRQSNGFIPGVRPGLPTAKYIDTIISRVIFPGAVFLAIIAMLPAVASCKYIGVSKEFSRFFGGTSMLIIIGVIIEMIQQAEGHFNMVYYDRMMRETERIPEL